MQNDERRLAELAMNRTESDTPEWPDAASRIREARMRAGLSPQDMAERLGMTVSAYLDIEQHRDEVFIVVRLRQLRQMGVLLGVAPVTLLLGSMAESTEPSITFADIAAGLLNRMAHDDITADQLGEMIGCDVTQVINDPEVLWSFDVDGMYTLAKAAGLDWVALLT